MTPPSSTPRGAAPPFAAVYFDCDSTLATVEGIDELVSGLAPAQQREVLALTQQAMDGTLPLADVYRSRLATIAPSRDALVAVGARYVAAMVPDADGVVQALQHLGKRVGIVSGGLLAPVQALAHHLGVHPSHVHAVPLQFAADGSYLDFDRSCPLWQNGGKVTVLKALPPDHRPLAFVGDGITDLETQGTAADLFVGFGGVAAREKVRTAAQAWFDTPTLAPLLRIVLSPPELARLGAEPRFAPLLSRAGL